MPDMNGVMDVFHARPMHIGQALWLWIKLVWFHLEFFSAVYLVGRCRFTVALILLGCFRIKICDALAPKTRYIFFLWQAYSPISILNFLINYELSQRQMSKNPWAHSVSVSVLMVLYRNTLLHWTLGAAVPSTSHVEELHENSILIFLPRNK